MKKYDIFISCKSEDYAKAEPVYYWLVEQGYNPFFAPVSLSMDPSVSGEPVVFGEEIDEALDQSDNMIVFASKAEYVKTGYVKDEWRTFVEEQRAGRKRGNLVTILEKVEVADLPIRLRPVQSFSLSTYKNGLLRYMGGNIIAQEQDEIKTREREEQERERKAREEQERKERERRVREAKGVFEVDGVKFKMVKVVGGTFTMGATGEQCSDALENEKPAHKVILSDYYIGETEVTQALWKAVMGYNPSYFKGDNLPVEQVSWNDIVERFIPALNRKTGLTYRLPTEAEWEYAARGGGKSKGYKYSGSNNIGEVAWYYVNSRGKTHPVKGKKANELGLYDMSGNVWEWCQEWDGKCNNGILINSRESEKDSVYVLRGGSWGSRSGHCCVSYHRNDVSGNNRSFIGFRLVLYP